ncbi:antibiotic biosynthesis monooxygenase family protein [Halobacteriales archaeon Cl-PHB]
MIVVANRFHVAEDYEAEFVDRFAEGSGNVTDHEGFVRFELLTPESHPHGETATHVAKTYWESMDAFRAWTQSEDFEDAHSGDAPEEMFTAPNELEIHSVAVERTGE